MTAIWTGRISAPGRQCEVVNGCFVATQFVKLGFGEKAALGKADWRLRVERVSSQIEEVAVGPEFVVIGR